MSALSDQYAVALFELAIEADEVDSIYAALHDFSLQDSSLIESFFMHPKINKKVKKETVEAMDYPRLFKDFLCVLIDNNRFLLIQDVKACYQKLNEAKHETMRIEVYSKTPLSEDRLTILRDEYERKYQRKVTLENKIDALIIGGLRFEFSGFIVNNTINQSIQLLKSYLTK